MADSVRKVDYFYIEVPNKAGEGAKALASLREAGVNLLAFTGFPCGRKAQVDFIPEDTAAFKAAAKKAGLRLSPKKTGFLIQGEDKIGAIAEILGKLAAANVNVTAMDAVSAGTGRYGAILWVKAPDLRKASKLLAALVPSAPAPSAPSPTMPSKPPEPGPTA
jgi:hypothetical protein